MISLLIRVMPNRAVLRSDWLIVERIGNWNHKRRAIVTRIVMKWFELEFATVLLLYFLERHINYIIVFQEFLLTLKMLKKYTEIKSSARLISVKI